MKITFTNQKSVSGIRVYSVDVDAARKAERNIKSNVTATYVKFNDAHDPIMEPAPVKWVDGVEYLDV